MGRNASFKENVRTIIHYGKKINRKHEFVRCIRENEWPHLEVVLKLSPTLIAFQDQDGNTGLHLAVKYKRIRVLHLLLDHSDINGVIDDVLNKTNNEGLTPLAMATAMGCEDLVATIQSKTVKLQDGENVLHRFAQDNQPTSIRHYLATFYKESNPLQMCLQVNKEGDFPALLAAKNGNKEALEVLLYFFHQFGSNNQDQLHRFVHHQNKQRQSLLTYLSHYRNVSPSGLATLLDMEFKAHNQDSMATKTCIRDTLGSSQGARFCLNLFLKMHQRPNRFEIAQKIVTVFSLTVLIPKILMISDMVSDCALIRDYRHDWWEEAHNATLNVTSLDRCLEQDQSPDIIEGCYARLISGKERFLMTLVIFLMPFLLYYFELLRFRPFSEWLEHKRDPQMSKCKMGIIHWIIRPLVNTLYLITWPIVTAVRKFFFRFKLEWAAKGCDIQTYRTKERTATAASSRAQIIEACTEASFQPMLQFYLIFQDIAPLSWSGPILSELQKIIATHSLPLFAGILSVITLAGAYTTRYRENKEFAITLGASAFFFFSLLFQISSRMVCFQMFAFALGPGNFWWAIIASCVHVCIMTSLHLIFSNSMAQWSQRPRDHRSGSFYRSLLAIRQCFLVIHNAFLNGLANIYVYNNLEINNTLPKIRKKLLTSMQSAVEEAPEEGITLKRLRRPSVVKAFVSDLIWPNYLTSNKPIVPDIERESFLTYVHSDQVQPSLFRQFLFEMVFFMENVAMLAFSITNNKYFRKNKFFPTLAIGCYGVGMIMKVIFYNICHPWASLIRPSSCCNYTSSCTLLSKTYDYEIAFMSCHVTRRRSSASHEGCHHRNEEYRSIPQRESIL
ncbi:hypothetical protein TCAL_15010 [Tigriopus californicus]|uniref:XK-related protein n=1 Tax=Tigriopus californicus TaxID=6832 RepID=A0A553P026_TIGCA|nr:hypothetical protein TCAL_15010 [Tigriopus californicus]